MEKQKIRKKTSELLDELRGDRYTIEEYFNANEDSFIELNLREFWDRMVIKSKKSKSNIINDSDISYVYYYEIIQGKKIPTKDKIVRLSLAMNMTLDECQEALRLCNQSMLYPRFKRDSILIHAIENKLSVFETQNLLLSIGENELK